MNHATFSIRDAHLSYSRGCRCEHRRRGQTAYMLEYRRGQRRDGVSPSVSDENGQLDLLSAKRPDQDSAQYREPRAGTSEPQGLRSVRSPSVGMHHRGADKNEMAAAKRQAKKPEVREAVLQAIVNAGRKGITRHRISEKTGISLQSVCGRVGECLKPENGWVYKSKNSEGGRGLLVATERGIEEARRSRDRARRAVSA